MSRVIGWAFVVLLISAAPSRAGYVITVAQTGSDVVATGTGSSILQPCPS